MRLAGLTTNPTRTREAFTLAEVVISIFIMMLVFSGIITAYIQGAYRAEWAGYNLAAQASACQELERAKCAVWDIEQTPVMNQIALLTNYYITTLDLPISGTNAVYVTNQCTINTITLSTNPAVSVYMVKVTATWPFRWKNKNTTYSNTVAGYFGPE